MYLKSGSPRVSAAALVQASDTARIGICPQVLLFASVQLIFFDRPPLLQGIHADDPAADLVLDVMNGLLHPGPR